MPCFDPEGVIFITNKWDTITLKKKDSDDDSDDDDEEIKTWESIKSDIERRWPAVKENNMFKMILTDVMQYYYYTFLKIQTGWLLISFYGKIFFYFSCSIFYFSIFFFK